MQRLIIALWTLLTLGAPVQAAVVYVSNVNGVNGYGTASTSYTRTQAESSSTPWPTIEYAVTQIQSGDVIYINNTGTEYSPNSGAGYLQLPNVSCTIETDPSQVTSLGKAVIGSSASSRIINSNTGYTFQLLNLNFDGGSSAKDVITNPVSPGVTLGNCDFKNFSAAVLAGSATNGIVVFDKCTLLAANGNSGLCIWCSTFSTGMSATIKGCACDVSGAVAMSAGSTVNTTLFRFTCSADGTRNTFSNGAYAVRLPHTATTTTVDIEYTDFSGYSSQQIVFDASSYDTVTSSLIIKYCTFKNSTVHAIDFVGTVSSGEIAYNYFSGTNSFVYLYSTKITNVRIHDNTLVQSGAINDPIYIPFAGAGIEVDHNNITSDSTGHVIEVGTDGQYSLVSNPNSVTTTVKLVDSSANTWIDQVFTDYSPTTSNPSQKISSAWFKMEKVGSPKGTVNAYLYSDNTGVPGTLLETSEYTLTASNLSTSSQQIEFWFPNHTQLTASTVYHIVLKYTGTPDATNYVTLDAEPNYTSKASTSSTGPGGGWSSSGNATLFNINFGDYDTVGPQIHDNFVRMNMGPSNITHCCFCGCTTGGKIYRNFVVGGGIPLIFKLVDGSDPSFPAICYDNLVLDHEGASEMCLRDKGSRDAQFYHNTAIVAGIGTNCAFFDADFSTGRYNGQPSQNDICENNIFVLEPGSHTGAVVVTGNTASAQPTVQRLTFDYNCVYETGNANMWTDYTSGTAVNNPYSDLVAAGFEVHGVNADPLLTSYTPSKVADFTPGAASPAIGMGLNLTSTVSTDYNSKAFISAGPTVGALNANYRSISPARTIVR